MCICARARACMQVSVGVGAHTHIYIYTYTHTHTGMGAHTHVCIHICAYIQLIVSHMLLSPGVFQSDTFLSVVRSDSKCMSPHSFLRFHVILFFFHIYRIGLSVMFFLFPCFTPTLFCFLCTQSLFCPNVFSIYFLVEFSLFLEVLFCLYYLTLSWYLLSLSFTDMFYFFKLHCQTCRLFCFGLFIPIFPSVFFLP